MGGGKHIYIYIYIYRATDISWHHYIVCEPGWAPFPRSPPQCVQLPQSRVLAPAPPPSGAVGPPGSSFRIKAVVVQYGITTALKLCKLTQDLKLIKTSQFLGRVPRVETVSPLGLGAPAGLWRRPKFECIGGFVQAMGSLVVFAKQSSDKLDMSLPRHWLNGLPTGKPSQSCFASLAGHCRQKTANGA